MGIPPLPGKASTTSTVVNERLRALRNVFPLDVADDLTHDELQALVSGLAGIALESRNTDGVIVAGIAPVQIDGTWREGFIVNPTATAAA